MGKLGTSELSNWLWDAASQIRVSVEACRSSGEEVLPLEDAVVLLQEAEEERSKPDKKLYSILKELGF